jgi:hypothetical protein
VKKLKSKTKILREKTRMRKIVIATLFCIVFAAIANADVFQAGGDRLTNLQNNDGGWGWPVTGASATNTIGPIAMGLAQAYQNTGSASQLAALQNAGGLLLGKVGTFSPSDGYLAVKLDNIFNTNTYSSYVKTNFYDKLAAGTYQRAGDATLYDTAAYVNRIRTVRSGDQANMAAWDIGTGLYAAKAIGADTTAWLAGTKAKIDELDSSNYYDVLGLAGAVLGLASTGEDYNPVAGSLSAASNLSDLANILASYQISSGGFAWNSGFVIPNDGDEATQETAYSILALNAMGTGFNGDVSSAQNYLKSVQLANGGWENYLGNGENNEITGEALWAVSVPEPATMCLLGLGALSLIRRKK